jgi:hypothetical protein
MFGICDTCCLRCTWSRTFHNSESSEVSNFKLQIAKYTNLHEFTRIYTNLHEFTRIYTNLHEFTRFYTILHELYTNYTRITHELHTNYQIITRIRNNGLFITKTLRIANYGSPRIWMFNSYLNVSKMDPNSCELTLWTKLGLAGLWKGEIATHPIPRGKYLLWQLEKQRNKE